MLHHTYGVPDPIIEGRPQDTWFFRMRGMQGAAYDTNIQVDAQYSGQPTLFLNHRVTDAEGSYLGVAGVAITLDTMNQVLARYQARYGRNIYFVSDTGKVILSGVLLRAEQSTLEQRSGMRELAPAIFNRSVTPTSLSYRNGKSDVLVNSRYVPELKWYLVVEQNVSANIVPLTPIFAVNFFISLTITLLVLVLVLVLVVTLLTVNRFQRRLQKMASTDGLTGLLNRRALTMLLHQHTLVSKRTHQRLSAILFDIDFFKSVNDTFGHVAGDSVIKQVARITLEVVRESDLVTRWGGEEYLVLLVDCKLSQAISVAETLRRRVAGHDFKLPRKNVVITISLGVAEHHEDDSETSFFTRADDALFGAKRGGRNYTNAAHLPAPAPQQL